MAKKPSARGSITRILKRGNQRMEDWHAGADVEIDLYAASLQGAARSLVKSLRRPKAIRTDLDVCPVILLYRESLEIRLKRLVGSGSNLLVPRIDHISVYTTHSLRWLAQMVRQIIKAAGWESKFACGGISNLAEFTTLVGEVEALDPVVFSVQASNAGKITSVPRFYGSFDIVKFSRRLDALFGLLDTTADALAAMWDEQNHGMGMTAGG